MSKDLKEEFPDMKEFSKRNLEVMRQWYLFWNSANTIAQQAVAQLEKTNQPVNMDLNGVKVGIDRNDI